MMVIGSSIHISFSFITSQIPEVLRAAITYPITEITGQTMDAVFTYKTEYISVTNVLHISHSLNE